ncbi:MAG: flagella basal body P-ring formation protein FlgA [Planctomycetota bacterium]|jgi:flagella basal body P-ring formation protein FlgA
MIAFASITLAAFAAFGGGDGNPDKIEIRVKTTAMVRGVDVRVGDLCEILPVGREAVEIAQLTLGRAPVQGYSRSVGRNELLQALVKGGYAPENITFDGASEAMVQTILVDVSNTEMVEAARAALTAVIELEGGDVEIEIPTAIRRVQAPPGRRSQELVARVRGGQTGIASAVVDVDVQVDGESYKRLPITFKLTRFQQVLRTVGPVREGSPLGPQNLELAREAVPQGSNLLLTSFEAIDGMVAARDLQSGRRLMLADTAPPAAIHRGETVTVIADSGRIKVSSRAVANHDAPIGGRITLTNPDSNRRIVGIVVAAGTVVVK